MNPRPEGYNYKKPDLETLRCQGCNADGMNRTGLIPIRYIGATTTGMWAVKCPQACQDGLVEEKK